MLEDGVEAPPLGAIAFGICLGALLAHLYKVFINQCVFGGRGTLPGRTDLKFETSHLHTSLGRVRVFTKQASNTQGERWAIFIHGFAGSLDVFADPARSNLCNEFLALGYNVLAFDLYGHGGSDAPDTRFSAELFAAQLSELVLHFNLQQSSSCSLTLVAHSMGCAVAVTFASLFPHLVNEVILLSPSVGHRSFPLHLRLALRVPVFRELVSACIIPTFGEGTNRGNLGFLRSCYRLLETRLESKGSWNAGERKTLKLCAALVDHAVLVLWGDADQVVHFSKAKNQLLHVLPRALLCACPGGDHMSFADGTTEMRRFYLDRITSFLRRDACAMRTQRVLSMREYYDDATEDDGEGGMF